MKTMESMTAMGHESVTYYFDEATGLKAIIAIHSTALGPAIGGARFYNYASEADALYDVLRLSRGMTFKNAACGLHAGGAKSVLIGDPKQLKNKALLEAFGRCVHKLGGRYYTAEDVNIGEPDIDIVNSQTPYCVGRKNVSGNPSPYTALGIFRGMEACAKEVYGSADMAGKTVAISGVGSVGYALAGMLHKAGAKLLVSDVNDAALKMAVDNFGATVVGVNDILASACDIFAPCAMGAVFNVENVKTLQCKIIAGCANNVLVTNEAGDAIDARGILYAPDYIINAGGVINCGLEIEEGGHSKEKATALVMKIYDKIEMVIRIAKEKGIPTYKAADEYALGIIKAAAKK
ncbi:MAG: hypothetical protein FWF84_01810 [Kiritimatiellaeota bacterium]|nr:hypothetical protein [Kiritimatiellota bacterium]